MPDAMTEEQFLRIVPAFCDGILDSRERIGFLNYIAAHPEAVHRVIAHEQFREEVRERFCRLSPSVSPSLNRRISEIASALLGQQKS